jgi:hypothetical protein
MASSSAARQAAYRARQMDAGAVRLDVIVDRSTIDALARLARHRGQTVRLTLEQIIGAAEDAAVAELGFLQRSSYFG